jgi:predicted Zn-ribbon and HTH transcriptional regulator
MEYNKYIQMSSEKNMLEELLSEIPEDRIIEKMGFQSRLTSIIEELKKYVPQAKPTKAKLTFRGKPVLGTYGIEADFGAKTASAFTTAITAIAASLSDNLRYMGRLPDREKNQLLITGTALGSFGFEFQTPPVTQLDCCPSIVEEALQKAQEFMQVSIDGTDDELAELVSEIHPRAVKKIADFLYIVAENESACALDFKNKTFRFKDFNQVKTSFQRLSEDNIKEEDKEINGKFLGYLPYSGSFEFLINGEDKPIKGKIIMDKEEKDIDVRMTSILNKEVSITFNITQVGQGRPSYRLQSTKIPKLESSLVQ